MDITHVNNGIIRKVYLEDTNDYIDVYDCYTFPYNEMRSSYIERGKHSCCSNVATFDIETTTLLKGECELFDTNFAFMYVWQFCIDGYICMGRTWEEYIIFINKLCKHIWATINSPLIVWVHNLQFEFQFFRDFFQVDSVFAKDKRNVIRANVEAVEYRCSNALTNMSLAKFTQKTKGVIHKKLNGKDFDYHIKRYPDTELTENEYGYCICDVLGLYEGILSFLEEDDLLSIPMTSTGFVRRDYRSAVQKNKKNDMEFKDSKLTPYTYALSIEASRGAIAGSNHLHTDEILEDVDSEDIKSSYPYQMMTKYFPTGKFYLAKCKTGSDKFYDYINQWCCYVTVIFEGLRLKKYVGIPYISKAKCRAIQGGRYGNGKVYMAEKCGMTCTEIDFKIICEQYYFNNFEVKELWVCRRKQLNREFRGHLGEMFQAKTDLEDGDKFLYDKYKNKINASFGMMLTDILHPTVLYEAHSENPWKVEEIPDIDKALNYYYKARANFLTFQHGVWVLAHGRSDLNEGMKIVGNDLVQVDTDSVKHLHNYRSSFNELNQKIIDKADNYSVKPYAMKNGHKHYLGVWEHEGKDNEFTYHKFKTLGAKKYASEDENGKMSITVSGLTKSAAKWFEDRGGLKAFKTGTSVPAGISGRTSSYYVDMLYPKTFMINGHKVTVGSNIAIEDVPYTLGITDEWLQMVTEGIVDWNEEFEFHGAYGCK